MEFACIWNAFGSRVDIIELMPKILPVVDDEISRRLTSLLKRKGITVNLETQVRRSVKKVKRRLSWLTPSTARLRSSGRTKCFWRWEGSPISAELTWTLWEFVTIDAALRLMTRWRPAYPVSTPWAIGGRTFWLTERLLKLGGYGEHTGEPDIYGLFSGPSCVFSIPECASVGITESAAREQGFDVVVSKFPFGANGRPSRWGDGKAL